MAFLNNPPKSISVLNTRLLFFLPLLLSFLTLNLLPAQAQTTPQPANHRFDKVVLDAGHGGVDIGARGHQAYEKDLTFAIVQRIAKLMQDSMKDVQVIQTRTTDFKVPLPERHRIANDAQADLFISIHINSTPGYTERVSAGSRTVGKGKRRKTVPVYRSIRHPETTTSGTETLVIGALRTGQKSAATGEYGDDLVGEPGLMDPNDPSTAIILQQYMSAFLTRSVSLANAIQSEFAVQGRVDRGVHQQSLEVLAGTVMPGVLVECGFINNPEEEAYMMSDRGQQEIAWAVFRAIKTYRAEQDRAGK